MAWMLCILWLSLPAALLAACGSASIKPFGQYSEYAIQPATATDGQDAKWADYLKTHFQKRATDRDCVIAGQAADDSQLQVTVDMDAQLGTDYAVEIKTHEVRLKARTTEAMLWLQYQFMAAASAADSRIETADLPAATLSCQRDTAGSFAFEYRSLYTPSNTNADQMPILGVGNVDYDWGLWGHNLHKLFSGAVPTEAQALIDGKRTTAQYCFSSEALYQAYAAYVTEQYGDGSDGVTTRFAVMPNDNQMVCQCAACRKAGNTATSATPAVTAMVERLAKRFPRQLFFTSAYATTRQPASHPLPANVGVVLSAIDLPMTTQLEGSKALTAFRQNIGAWQRCTQRIYVWDYMRNYDDYLTPYPCLRQIQERLRLYRKMGIKGVFYNGSGYDYASFDDMQTYVLAQLLIDPETDIEACVARFYAKAYPVTGQLLGHYYTSLEAASATHTLPFYGGIAEAMGNYLNADSLSHFISRLDRASKQAGETERPQLNRLLTALAFTQLEVARCQSQCPDAQHIAALTSLLSHHTAFSDMAHYREADGDIDEYLRQWQTDLSWLTPNGSLIAGKALTPLAGADESAARALTDGRQGFVTDYHTGWVITSAPQLRLQTSISLPADLTVEASLLHAPVWHIYAPSAIEVWQGATCHGRTLIAAPTQRQRVKASVRASGLLPGVPTEIRIIQSTSAQGRKTLAADEITLTP